MKRLPRDATDAEILDAVREWAALLAAERYRDAHAFLNYAPDRAEHWTPELVATIIRNYGSPEPCADGRTFRVTPLDTASGALPPRHEVERFDRSEANPEFLGFIWFDLPLNGELSDLTAIINLVVDGDDIVLELDDIHVM